jgi:antitoxin (DNA-binding transcriptional repressor) of toxin-antitoxin stability system
MREVGAFEAKNKLGQLLDLVECGEEIVITRHGRRWRALSRRKKAATATRRGPP